MIYDKEKKVLEQIYVEDEARSLDEITALWDELCDEFD